MIPGPHDIRMPIDMFVITNYYADNVEQIAGALGYRYVGLYGSAVKSIAKASHDFRVYWYSTRDHSLRTITENDISCRQCSILSATREVIGGASRRNRPLAVLVAHPYAFLDPKWMALNTLLSLLVLNLPHAVAVRIFLDDFDPPVEARISFSVKPPPRSKLAMYRAFNRAVYWLSDYDIVTSEFWKNHLSSQYCLDQSRMFVVPNGALVNLIDYSSKESPRSGNKAVRLLYAGSAIKVKDIDKMVDMVSHLREKGLNVELYVAGHVLMDLPKWVHSGSYYWPTFIREVLTPSDICLIPYPEDKISFTQSVLAKLFDYMAAGKPIVSTNLIETGRIIRQFNCGLVARNWDEFGEHVERLYKDPAFARELGANGRKAVEKYYNFEILGGELAVRILHLMTQGSKKKGV